MLYLTQIGNRWCYRRRIPQDLQQYFPFGVLKRSLRTSSKATAKPLAAQLHATIERLFLAIQMNILSDQQIESLVASFVKGKLNKNEERRVLAPTAETKAWSAYRVPQDDEGGRPLSGVRRKSIALTQAAEHLKEWLATGGLLEFHTVQDAASEQLRDAGLEVDKSSAEYGKLLRMLARAHIDVCKVEAERCVGNYDSDIERRVMERIGEGQSQAHKQVVKDFEASVLPVLAPHTQVKITLAEVAEKWLKHLKRKKRAESTRERYNRNVPLLLGLLGGDRQISSFHRHELLELVDRVERLPKNMNIGRYKHFDLATLEQMAVDGKIPSQHLMARRTVNGYLQTAQEVFRFASENIWIGCNPALGLTIPLTAAERIASKKLRYTQEELRTLFDDLPYKKKTAYKCWVPLIALYTSARLAEILQLRVSDFREEDGIPYISFQVVEEGDDLDGRAIKTESSRRKTPLHPHLLRLGLLKWVDRLRGSGKQDLFSGVASKDFSNWWWEFLYGRIEKFDRKNFHSFRRTLLDELKQEEVAPATYNAIAGHAPADRTDPSYTEHYRLPIQLKALKRADFKLDLAELKKRFRRLL